MAADTDLGGRWGVTGPPSFTNLTVPSAKPQPAYTVRHGSNYFRRSFRLRSSFARGQLSLPEKRGPPPNLFPVCLDHDEGLNWPETVIHINFYFFEPFILTHSFLLPPY